MALSQQNGNFDWMGLAAQMFLSKLKNQPPQQKIERKPSPLLQNIGRNPSPLLQTFGRKPSTLPPRTNHPLLKPRAKVQEGQSYLPPDCVATIKQFEALRIQLLRQLVMYQTQILALKMPSLPEQLTRPAMNILPKDKITHREMNRNQKISSKKVKSVQTNENKKWEKVQYSANLLKTPNKRRTLHTTKPKKTSKKGLKRVHEIHPGSVSNHYFNTIGNPNKKTCCQSYQSFSKNFSSSLDSINSASSRKCNFDFNTFKGIEVAHKDSELITATCAREGGPYLQRKNQSRTVFLPQRKPSKFNKKIASAFAVGTATDDTQSTM